MADQLGKIFEKIEEIQGKFKDAIEYAEAPPEETFEQRQAREALEEYRRRQEQSLIERKEILERNGLKFEDHTPEEGVEIYRRCCGK